MCLHETWILFFIYFFGLCCGQLQINPSVQNAERSVNESYAVTCSGDGAVGTAWRGPGKKPISARHGRVHTEERETGAVSLVFENIHRSDKGVYTCTSSVKNVQTSVQFTLTVVRPIKFIAGLSEQNLTQNLQGLIRCEATGEPKPTIVWYKNSKPIEGSRYTIDNTGLHIKNVTKDDEDSYLCRALQITLQRSTLQDLKINVSVHYKPQWNGRQHGWLGYIGGVTNLTCEVDAKPPAEFSWARVGKSLDSPRIITEPNRSVLQVNVTDESVFGSYECRAWNSAGNISYIEELKEGVKPNPPKTVNIEQTEDQIMFKVKWSNEEQDILGIRVEYQEFSSSPTVWEYPNFQDLFLADGSLVLKDLKSGTDYTMRVATLSLSGLSDYTEEMRFVTSSAVVSFKISIMFAVILALVNLIKQ